MHTGRLIFCVVLSFISGHAVAEADARVISAEDRASLAIVAYDNGMAVVTDMRDASLAEDTSLLRLTDVSTQLRPETVLLRSASQPGEFQVTEQWFDYVPPTPDGLLRAYSGRTVAVIRIHPTTGEEWLEQGTLLGYREGPVVHMDGRIETAVPGRLAFPDLSGQWPYQPAVVARTQVSASAEHRIELVYQTPDINWEADYVGRLNADGSAIALRARARLTNTGDTDYINARWRLIAGALQRAAAEYDQPVRFQGMAEAKMRDVVPETVFEYHAYPLQQRVDLPAHQSKQVTLFDAERVPVVRRFIVESRQSGILAPMSEPEKLPVQVRMEFQNSDRSGLGRPLPGGVVRVYQPAADAAQLIGESPISRTAPGETVKLALGHAFDLTAERQQAQFQKLAGFGPYNYTYQAAFTVTLRNAKPDPVTVWVREPMPGDWEVIDETMPHARLNAVTAQWTVTVPANGSTELRYAVRVRL